MSWATSSLSCLLLTGVARVSRHGSLVQCGAHAGEWSATRAEDASDSWTGSRQIRALRTGGGTMHGIGCRCDRVPPGEASGHIAGLP